MLSILEKLFFAKTVCQIYQIGTLAVAKILMPCLMVRRLKLIKLIYKIGTFQVLWTWVTCFPVQKWTKIFLGGISMQAM